MNPPTPNKAVRITKYYLLEHGEAGACDVLHAFNTDVERDAATQRLIYGESAEGPDELEQWKKYAEELRETGSLEFEGDPGLEWFTAIEPAPSFAPEEEKPITPYTISDNPDVPQSGKDWAYRAAMELHPDYGDEWWEGVADRQKQFRPFYDEANAERAAVAAILRRHAPSVPAVGGVREGAGRADSSVSSVLDCLNTLAHELEADPGYGFAALSDMRGETFVQKLARVRQAVESTEELRRLLALVAERADFTGATQLEDDVNTALSGYVTEKTSLAQKNQRMESALREIMAYTDPVEDRAYAIAEGCLSHDKDALTPHPAPQPTGKQAEGVTDTQMLDFLQQYMTGSGYPIQLKSGRDEDGARQNHVELTVGIGSGPWQKSFRSPPGGITLRSCLANAIKLEGQAALRSSNQTGEGRG